MKANNKFQYHFKKLVVTNRLVMFQHNTKGILFPYIVSPIDERLSVENIRVRTKTSLIERTIFEN